MLPGLESGLMPNSLDRVYLRDLGATEKLRSQMGCLVSAAFDLSVRAQQRWLGGEVPSIDTPILRGASGFR